ncbi:MAG TPA: DUF2461 domain-containing protein [Acidimicrobiales bacterium]|jgi:uncharacterized protein (TIGR02453 family)|nr:DUF2461 domain-containing protein [Acidimicrobiales bacterium]
MAFRGWPETAFAFYEGLEADNSKAYWLDHKDTYERDVKAPMDALLAELTNEFGETKLFRPYRDTRFSRDKSPYKTAIAARIGEGYVQFSADGLFTGAGMYHMMPDQLARFRNSVASEKSGKKLEGVVATLTKGGLNVHSMEELKTAPKGYPMEHPRIGLLRMKGLVASRAWEPAGWLSTSAAKKRVADVLRATGPLLAWLEANVGPSAEADA